MELEEAKTWAKNIHKEFYANESENDSSSRRRRRRSSSSGGKDDDDADEDGDNKYPDSDTDSDSDSSRSKNIKDAGGVEEANNSDGSSSLSSSLTGLIIHRMALQFKNAFKSLFKYFNVCSENSLVRYIPMVIY